MEVEITVSEKDVERITRLGLIPWTKITEEEKKEFENLIGLFGSAVSMKIINK